MNVEKDCLKQIESSLAEITNVVKSMIDRPEEKLPIATNALWGVGDTLRRKCTSGMYVLIGIPINYDGVSYLFVQQKNKGAVPDVLLKSYFGRTAIAEIKEGDIVRHNKHGNCVIKEKDSIRNSYRLKLPNGFICGWFTRDTFARCCLRTNE